MMSSWPRPPKIDVVAAAALDVVVAVGGRLERRRRRRASPTQVATTGAERSRPACATRRRATVAANGVLDAAVALDHVVAELAEDQVVARAAGEVVVAEAAGARAARRRIAKVCRSA